MEFDTEDQVLSVIMTGAWGKNFLSIHALDLDLGHYFLCAHDLDQGYIFLDLLILTYFVSAFNGQHLLILLILTKEYKALS